MNILPFSLYATLHACSKSHYDTLGFSPSYGHCEEWTDKEEEGQEEGEEESEVESKREESEHDENENLSFWSPLNKKRKLQWFHCSSSIFMIVSI